MSISYKLVERAVAGSTDQKKWGAQIIYRDEVSFEQLTELISLRSLMCRSDVLHIINTMLEYISYHLRASHNVSLGSFGTLLTTLQTEQVSDPKDYTRSHIRRSRICFKPGQLVREELGAVTFQMNNNA